MRPKDIVEGDGDGRAPLSRIEGSALVVRGVEGASLSFLILGSVFAFGSGFVFGSALAFGSFLAFERTVVPSSRRVGPPCGICLRFDVGRALAFLDSPCPSRRGAFVPVLTFLALGSDAGTGSTVCIPMLPMLRVKLKFISLTPTEGRSCISSAFLFVP